MATLALIMMLTLSTALMGAGAARAEAGTAYIRMIHAASIAPAVDVYLDNGAQPILSNFAFGHVTDYVPIAAGSHTIKLTPTGKAPDQAAITSTITTASGMNYTLAAVGDSANPPALIAFSDDNTIVSGKSKVRVYHLSGDAGLAGVSVGGKTVIPAIDFKNASEYLTVDPGTYTFDLHVMHGTKTVSLPANLAANKVTSVFGVGMVASTGNDSFRFVVATAAAMPTGMPPTGFAPHPTPAATPSTGQPDLLAVTLLALATFFGAIAIATRRRRPLLHQR